MIALILKEIRSFFSSLLGYVVVSAFLLILGLFLWVFDVGWNILSHGIATLDSFFTLAPWVLVFFVPAITMRTFSEERRSGTLELLLTHPLKEGQIINAKFIGAVTLILTALLPTLWFVYLTGYLGSPQWNLDMGVVWGSYLGLFLLATTMASIGIFASSMTKEPLESFLFAMILSTVGYIAFNAVDFFDLFGTWDYIILNLGFEHHYRNLSSGLIDTRDIAYFLFVNVFFLQSARFVLALERGRLDRESTRLIIILSTAVVLFFAVHIVDYNFDVTKEKRYELTEGSYNLLKKIKSQEKEVLVTCYLTGDYPVGWKMLEIAIREKLEDLSDYSEGKFRFQFEDIYESDDSQTIGQNQQSLLERGLSFTRIIYNEKGKQSNQIIWPAAIVHCNGKEIPVQFFNSEIPQPSSAMIQGAIDNIEFHLSSALNRALERDRKQIAFIEGHGELEEIEVGDLVLALEKDYGVTRVRLDGKLNALCDKLDGMKYRTNKFDLAIIAKPDSMFSDKDRLILDQFLLAGGRVLWMVDPVVTDLDSLKTNQVTMATENKLNIYHQLFDYGVRLNKDLVLDPICAPILLDAGPLGNQRNQMMFSWYFAPVSIPQIESDFNHAITTNLDPVHFDFVSSIDLVDTDPNIKKTVLLYSSEKARRHLAPVRVTSSIVDLEPSYFTTHTKPYTPFAVLLEGKFKSHFTDILPPALAHDPDFAFRSIGRPSAMVVISDGDICKNKVVDKPSGRIKPLGYDRYANSVVYDNKEFLLNTINYLLDENSLISLRSRSVTIRNLDQTTIKENGLVIKSIALVVPIFVIILVAVILLSVRKRLYAIKHEIKS